MKVFILLFRMITYLVDEDNGIPEGPPIMPHGAFWLVDKTGSIDFG